MYVVRWYSTKQDSRPFELYLSLSLALSLTNEPKSDEAEAKRHKAVPRHEPTGITVTGIGSMSSVEFRDEMIQEYASVWSSAFDAHEECIAHDTP